MLTAIASRAQAYWPCPERSSPASCMTRRTVSPGPVPHVRRGRSARGLCVRRSRAASADAAEGTSGATLPCASACASPPPARGRDRSALRHARRAASAKGDRRRARRARTTAAPHTRRQLAPCQLNNRFARANEPAGSPLVRYFKVSVPPIYKGRSGLRGGFGPIKSGVFEGLKTDDG